MATPPFTVQNELYKKLRITSNPRSICREHNSIRATSQAGATAATKNYLPGQPRIALRESSIDLYLKSEFVTEALNRLSRHLWLVAKNDSSHVSTLTHQIVRGREIIVTEKPELHLVWIYDRVYIKPIPKYLLSHAFWEFYLVSGDSPISEPLRKEVARAALGFLRSYFHLIQHKSDFNLARDEKLKLVPKNISHAEFVRFIVSFKDVSDEDVAPRYKFGELRLTRLNFWSKIILRRFTYHKVHGQYGAYFARFYGPLLFVFAVFSVMLSAMQVVLTVQPLVHLGPSWTEFALVSRGFSIFAICSVIFAALFLLSVFSALTLRELVHVVKTHFRKRRTTSTRDVEQKLGGSQT